MSSDDQLIHLRTHSRWQSQSGDPVPLSLAQHSSSCIGIPLNVTPSKNLHTNGKNMPDCTV